MANYKDAIAVRLTSKKAIAKAIALKLFRREFIHAIQKHVLKAAKKLLFLILHFQKQTLPIIKEKVKKNYISLRQLKKEAVISYFKSLPLFVFAWVRSRKLPSLKQFSTFVGQEAIANVIAWTAALISSQLISQYFTTKSWKNMWGTFAKKDKMLISQETFEILDWWVAYLMGLIMLLTVHHLINKLYEYRKKA